jgi:hypothetical protein
MRFTHCSVALSAGFADLRGRIAHGFSYKLFNGVCILLDGLGRAKLKEQLKVLDNNPAKALIGALHGLDKAGQQGLGHGGHPDVLGQSLLGPLKKDPVSALAEL